MRIAVSLVILILQFTSARGGDNWPQFCGPEGNGASDARGLPLRWSETENIKWKTSIHGRGWSSPVIWGNQVWLTTATEDGKDQFAVCIDRETGKVLHDVPLFHNDKPAPIAPMNSYASPTPVIEEGRVYLNFGTFGTACVDTASGKILWSRSDIHCEHSVGPGSSPVLAGDVLVIPMDGRDVQYVIGLDKKTGDTVWKTMRSTDFGDRGDEFRKAFCTPVVIDFGGRRQVVCVGAVESMSYDPATGKELWKVRHEKDSYSNTSRPLFCFDTVLINTGASQQIWAVRPDGSGDVSKTHVKWKLDRKTVPFMPSPTIVGDLIYLVFDGGIISCVEAKTGKIVWQKRVGGSYEASPIAAEGRVYFFSDKCAPAKKSTADDKAAGKDEELVSDEGYATVIAAGRQYKELAVNKLDQGFLASPAVAGKALYLRSKTHLYRIEQSGE
jgi:outer membrane protein assembly factor BamB